jgi:hypothetical protein
MKSSIRWSAAGSFIPTSIPRLAENRRVTTGIVPVVDERGTHHERRPSCRPSERRRIRLETNRREVPGGHAGPGHGGTAVVETGFLVQIEQGVQALIAFLSLVKVVNPANILEVGDEVEAIVTELDMDQRRVSLSLRRRTPKS